MQPDAPHEHKLQRTAGSNTAGMQHAQWHPVTRSRRPCSRAITAAKGRSCTRVGSCRPAALPMLLGRETKQRTSPWSSRHRSNRLGGKQVNGSGGHLHEPALLHLGVAQDVADQVRAHHGRVAVHRPSDQLHHQSHAAPSPNRCRQCSWSSLTAQLQQLCSRWARSRNDMQCHCNAGNDSKRGATVPHDLRQKPQLSAAPYPSQQCAVRRLQTSP